MGELSSPNSARQRAHARSAGWRESGACCRLSCSGLCKKAGLTQYRSPNTTATHSPARDPARVVVCTTSSRLLSATATLIFRPNATHSCCKQEPVIDAVLRERGAAHHKSQPFVPLQSPILSFRDTLCKPMMRNSAASNIVNDPVRTVAHRLPILRWCIPT